MLQRKTRLIANELGAAGQAGIGLSIAEGLLLHILQAEKDKSVKQLAELLALDRSWVSRLVSQLEARKFVTSQEGPEDKRSKIVLISSKGREALIALNGFRFQVMQRATLDLQPAQQSEFAVLLRKVADSLKAHRFIVTPQSHPIDAELARLSWVIGVMGENFLESGMGVAQFHIYETIANAQNSMMLASDVNDLLPFDMSTITRSIVNFEKQGLFIRKTAEHDRRSAYVSLSKKGEESWKTYQKNAVEIFKPSADALSAKELEKLLGLFEIAVRNMPLARASSLKSNLEMKEINNSELLKKAREFSESNIFNSKLLEKENKRVSYLLYSGPNICGIASVEPKGKSAKDDKFTIALSGLSDKECGALMKQLNRWRRRHT